MRNQLLRQLNKDGSTWLIYDTLNKRVCIRKTIPEDRKDIYEQLNRLKLNNTPRVFECERLDNGRCAVYEEYIEGLTLETRINNGEQFSLERVITITKELTHIVMGIHKHNIIHRDIKPSNVMIDKNGRIYLIDFGIARNLKINQTTDTYMLGTEGFAAPEQYGFRQSDQRTDIYAIGALANYLLTGKLPNQYITKDKLGLIISRCTSIEPTSRYKSSHALYKAICGMQRNKPYYFSRIIAVGVFICAMIGLTYATVRLINTREPQNIIEDTSYSNITTTTFRKIIKDDIVFPTTTTTEADTEQPTTEQPTTTHLSSNVEVVAKGNCGDSASYVIYSNGKARFYGEGNISNRYFIRGEEPWRDCKEIIIQNGITGIEGDSFFANMPVEYLSLSNTLERIDSAAFANCQIEKIVLPKCYLNIGERAFANNHRLTELEIPANAWCTNAFIGCDNLTKIVFAEGRRDFNIEFLSGVNNLSELYLPKSLQKISYTKPYSISKHLDIYYDVLAARMPRDVITPFDFHNKDISLHLQDYESRPVWISKYPHLDNRLYYTVDSNKHLTFDSELGPLYEIDLNNMKIVGCTSSNAQIIDYSMNNDILCLVLFSNELPYNEEYYFDLTKNKIY